MENQNHVVLNNDSEAGYESQKIECADFEMKQLGHGAVRETRFARALREHTAVHCHEVEVGEGPFLTAGPNVGVFRFS